MMASPRVATIAVVVTQPKGTRMQRPSRRQARRSLVVAMWTLAALVFAAPAASAYIDPVSTGTLFSAIVASLAAAGTAISMYWSRIVGFFRRDGAGGSGSE